MTSALIPSPPATDYLRVAVAQIHYNPAAFISEVHFLEQPYGLEEPWCQPPTTPKFQEIRPKRKAFGKKMRDLYTQQLSAKLRALVAQCAEWGCDLLVLPEYSVPPELIAGLLPACGRMVAVLGTHYIERSHTRTSFYPDLGIPDANPGFAIAPVASNGLIVASQLKLQQSKWETELKLGTEWKATSIERLANRSLGVLICIDFLNDRDGAFANIVLPQLAEASLLAVPSLTRAHTRDEFEADLRKEAKRYGRTVAYANIASGGGTTIYIDDANSNTGFPHGIPVLQPGQEGVVIVDVDAHPDRRRGATATRLDHRPVARSVAAAQLVYLATDAGKAYRALVDEIATTNELDDLITRVQQRINPLQESADSLGGPLSSRLIDLIEKADTIADCERVHCRLRDVFVPAPVMPPEALRDLMFELAEAELATWSGGHEVQRFISESRRALEGARMTRP